MTVNKPLVGIVLMVPMSVHAQDVVVTVNPVVGTFSAEYFGITPVRQLFAVISVRLSGDAPINITDESPVFTSLLYPMGAEVTGNGSNEVTFFGEAPGQVLGGPQDSSNPFEPFTFDYAGSLDNFDVEFYGLTGMAFIMPPFGNGILNMVNGDGTLGSLSFRIDIVPAPASATLLGLAGLGALRRRR